MNNETLVQATKPETMTVKGKLEHMLIQKGMSDQQAKSVMEEAMPSLADLVENYQVDFNDDCGAYPNVIYEVLMTLIKPIALEWIIKNKPQAWFKPMFQ